MQLNLGFKYSSKSSEYGTFKDSLRAPVHRWFSYPAGYSYQFVEAKILEHSIKAGDVIIDPFAGTGTTSLTAQQLGINSIGVEAHPFVHWVADTKINHAKYLEVSTKQVRHILEQAKEIETKDIHLEAKWNELIDKCFDSNNLDRLFALKNVILNQYEHQSFFKLALTSALRNVTSADNFPYISPSKCTNIVSDKNAYVEFEKQCDLMMLDVAQLSVFDVPESEHLIVNGDARKLSEYVISSADLILTSPPYLNNFDYADRTRLETYFWGLHRTWGDITSDVRNKLMVSTTTQIHKANLDCKMPKIKELNVELYEELDESVQRLSELRLERAGKKSYDGLVSGYFNDMCDVLLESGKSLKTGGAFVLVIGDSAPYGVHIATDEIIGRLAIAAGFTDYRIEVLRRRGNKWASNSRRHKVPLRESVLTLFK